MSNKNRNRPAQSRPASAPRTAAVPTDHLPKTERPKVETVDGGKRVTLRGVTVVVDDDALDDFELLEDLRAAQNEDVTALPSLLRRLVGEDYKAVLDALRNDKGRVTVEAGANFVKDLFEAINPNS